MIVHDKIQVQWQQEMYDNVQSETSNVMSADYLNWIRLWEINVETLVQNFVFYF